jgi:hypothetical protein
MTPPIASEPYSMAPIPLATSILSIVNISMVFKSLFNEKISHGITRIESLKNPKLLNKLQIYSVSYFSLDLI